MFDLRLMREQPDRVRESLKRRGADEAIVGEILAADETRRTSLAELVALRNQRNTISKEIGRMKEDEREAQKAQVINVRPFSFRFSPGGEQVDAGTRRTRCFP